MPDPKKVIDNIQKIKKIGCCEGEVTFFKAEDIFNTIIQFIETDTYKKMVEATASGHNATKESSFKAGMMLAPSVIFAYCKKLHGSPAPIPDKEPSAGEEDHA